MAHRLSRREFLKVGAAGAAAVGLSGSWTRLLQAEEPAALATVDLAVGHGAAADAVRGAVDLLGGMSAFVKKGDFVFLKPNMSFGTPPEMGATTHPEVVATVARLCMDAGAGRVLVGDHTIRAPEVCLEYTGIQAACEGMDKVNVVALNDWAYFEDIVLPDGRALQTTSLASDVRRADVLINLPVAKSHSAAGVAFGIKNLMGLVWDRKVFHTKDLNQCIADLASAVRPALTIMDATRALVQGGPSGPGRTEPLNQVVAGIDPLAVDSYTLSLAKWYNRRFTPRQVRHFVAARDLGVGSMDVEAFRVAHAGETTD